MTTHRPRKRFGQHFLTDLTIIDKLIQAINPQPSDHFVEIGPGHGILTTALLTTVKHLDIIEIDNDLITELTAKFATTSNLTIHHADALQFDFSKITTNFRLAGNLPYNISTPLIFHLLQTSHHMTDMCFMLQKEVVNRLSATVGTSAYGRLSVMVQYYCEVQALFNVAPQAFYPAPRVQSAVVRLVPRRLIDYPVADINIFSMIVRHAFNQRRKQIKNALQAFMTIDQLAELHIDHHLRPEQLALKDYVDISNYLYKSGAFND